MKFPIRRRSVLIVAFEGCQVLDIAGPLSVLESANRLLPQHLQYQISMGGVASSEVSTSGTLSITGQAILNDELLHSSDVIILPGFERSEQGLAVDRELLRFIRSADAAGKTLVSIGTGSYLFGYAGVLDRKKCTTHWSCIADFKRANPNAEVCEDKIYQRDGNIWTSAGATTGIDLMLAMIAEDFTDTISKKVAANLILTSTRPESHPQKSSLLDMYLGCGKSLVDVILHVQANPQDRHDLESMADRANMSLRTFARRFHDEFGMPPARMVRQIRCEYARDLSENTDFCPKQVARMSGFSTVKSLRRNLEQFNDLS